MTDENSAAHFSIILFDLGGVLLHLRDTGSNFGIEGEERRFHRSWLLSPSVREFERGAISMEQFARRIVPELQLPYDWKEFLQRFDSWPEKLYPGVAQLLAHLGKNHRVALLSNTNAAHWGRDDIAGIIEQFFDHTFLSFRTGLLKPDGNSFEQVTRHYACPPNDILFLDDNPLNVDAALAFGIRACLTRGIADVHNALNANGISPPADLLE